MVDVDRKTHWEEVYATKGETGVSWYQAEPHLSLELGLDAADYTTRATVVKLLLEHPELMERPVVFRGKRAVIARPSENVLSLIDGS